MIKPLVYDVEANGLTDVSEIHCVVAKNLETGKLARFYNTDKFDLKEEDSLDFPFKYIPSAFNNATILIGHNIIGYDNDLMAKFFGLGDLIERVHIVDTLVWSQTLNPDRKLPRGCPTHILNPVTKKQDIVGPHSLHAWGYRVARSKPSHYDWTTFSGDMLHRCQEDVLIQELVLHALLKEADMSYEELLQSFTEEG